MADGNMRPRALLAGIVALCVAGCSTFENGMTEEIPVVSDPSGGTVATSNGTPGCTTPCKLSFNRTTGTFVVSVSKDGFVKQDVEVKTRAAPDTNVLPSGAIRDAVGALDNPIEGNVEHYPNPIIVKLQPGG